MREIFLFVKFNFPQNKKAKGEKKQMKKGSSNKSLSKNGTSNEDTSSKSSSNNNLANKVLSKNGVRSNGSKNKGITLIALVISIIVILILAGVSLSATVGDNGVITKAQQAKLAQELAQAEEELEFMFADFNTDTIMGDATRSISEFLNDKVADGTIDDFKVYPVDGNLMMVIKKGSNYFYVKEDDGYYSATQMETSLSDIQAGFTVVTADSFSSLEDGSMQFNLEGDASATLIFYDEINDSFNFVINGGNVTIYVTQDMTLTNRDMARSALEIAPGATLNLYIDDDATLTVDSGYGMNGEKATGLGAQGGPGGYAGIHVPWVDSNNNGLRDTGEYAILNLLGTGTVYAYGGDAGDGEGAVSANTGGGRRRWCRCWNWRKRWKWWKWKCWFINMGFDLQYGL
jgi:hypothetical protein